jgi:antitoxin component of RelBE/YafQ-DinJ toxin-antitoxin module
MAGIGLTNFVQGLAPTAGHMNRALDGIVGALVGRRREEEERRRQQALMDQSQAQFAATQALKQKELDQARDIARQKERGEMLRAGFSPVIENDDQMRMRESSDLAAAQRARAAGAQLSPSQLRVLERGGARQRGRELGAQTAPMAVPGMAGLSLPAAAAGPATPLHEASIEEEQRRIAGPAAWGARRETGDWQAPPPAAPAYKPGQDPVRASKDQARQIASSLGMTPDQLSVLLQAAEKQGIPFGEALAQVTRSQAQAQADAMRSAFEAELNRLEQQGIITPEQAAQGRASLPPTEQLVPRPGGNPDTSSTPPPAVPPSAWGTPPPAGEDEPGEPEGGGEAELPENDAELDALMAAARAALPQMEQRATTPRAPSPFPVNMPAQQGAMPQFSLARPPMQGVVDMMPDLRGLVGWRPPQASPDQAAPPPPSVPPAAGPMLNAATDLATPTTAPRRPAPGDLPTPVSPTQQVTGVMMPPPRPLQANPVPRSERGSMLPPAVANLVNDVAGFFGGQSLVDAPRSVAGANRPPRPSRQDMLRSFAGAPGIVVPPRDGTGVELNVTDAPTLPDEQGLIDLGTLGVPGKRAAPPVVGALSMALEQLQPEDQALLLEKIKNGAADRSQATAQRLLEEDQFAAMAGETPAGAPVNEIGKRPGRTGWSGDFLSGRAFAPEESNRGHRGGMAIDASNLPDHVKAILEAAGFRELKSDPGHWDYIGQ